MIRRPAALPSTRSPCRASGYGKEVTSSIHALSLTLYRSCIVAVALPEPEPLERVPRRLGAVIATIEPSVDFALASSCSPFLSQAKLRPVGPRLITPARFSRFQPWRRCPARRRQRLPLPLLIWTVQIRSNRSDRSIPLWLANFLKSPYNFLYLHP